MSLAFIDIETTGLDPDRHLMWELAIIRRTAEVDSEFVWQFGVDLSQADSAAFRISHFYDRFGNIVGEYRVAEVARMVAKLLDGVTLIGAVPSFDAGFIGPWLRANGQCPTWHHRLRCVETLTAGHLRNPDLGGLAGCCKALGIEQSGEHTALGDARAARDVWDHVMAPHAANSERTTR
jgi:DNA polymerase III epsilon subunit-like protein